MVGQEKNKRLVEAYKNSPYGFPRFMIITGEKGAGKRTLATYIAKEGIKGFIAYSGIGVEDVRNTIETSYKCNAPVVYIFADADKMSPQAKNALLKITEEPPRQAYFILTFEDPNNCIETLRSRATELKMEPYLRRDLIQFTDNDIIIDVAYNIGQVEELLALNVDEFVGFCNEVLDNIAVVTGVNAFKIANKFKFKEDGEGYNPILFFQCLSHILWMRVIEAADRNDMGSTYYNKMMSMMVCCGKYKRELKIRGVKKESVFDLWILDAREILQ